MSGGGWEFLEALFLPLESTVSLEQGIGHIDLLSAPDPFISVSSEIQTGSGLANCISNIRASNYENVRLWVWWCVCVCVCIFQQPLPFQKPGAVREGPVS